MCMEELVQRVKQFQRMSEEHKQSWYAFCSQQGTSSYDPARHDPASLQNFLNAAESGELQSQEWGDEKAPLVHRVKEIQRRSEGHKQAWWRWCGQQGTSNFDPNRHDVYALQMFLNAFDAGAIYVDEHAVADKGKGKGWGGWNAASSSWSEGSGWGGWGHHWGTMTPLEVMSLMMGMMGGGSGMGVGMGGKGKGQWNTNEGPEGKPGDWICPGCGNINFSSRDKCNKCGSGGRGQERLGMKKGDWICPSCGDLVFASRSACKMCSTPKPEEACSSSTPAKGGRYNPY